jgi:diguanylate cyclase (GGDEF)-like protein
VPIDIREIISARDDADETRFLERFAATLDGIEIPVCVTDEERRSLVFMNSAASRCLPWAEDPNIAVESCPWRSGPQQGETDQSDEEWRNRWEFLDSDAGRWYLITDSLIDWVDGARAHFEMAIDITSMKKREERLLHYASTDKLTGAYNREWGLNILQEAVQKDRRMRVISCLCFLDLDGLKIVNDTYGHDEGDELITSFVSAIRASSRGADVLCRWGGDEFVLYLHDCEKQHAVKIMGKIADEFREFKELEKHPYNHSFSYGVVEVKPRSRRTNIEKLIAKADEQMYIQKNAKRTSDLHLVS